MVTSRLCGSRQSLLGATAAALQQYNKRDKQDKRRIPLPVIFFSSSSTEDAAAFKGKKKKKKKTIPSSSRPSSLIDRRTLVGPAFPFL